MTRNNFVDKEKEANLSVDILQHFSLVCMRFSASTLSTYLLSFVSMSLSKIFKCVSMLKSTLKQNYTPLSNCR